MSVLMPWKDYVQIENPREAAAACRMACGKSFEQELARIRKLDEVLKPRKIACLGAGCLNDFPVREVLERGADVTFVEWVPGLTQAALAQKMVYHSGDGLVCMCCRAPGELAHRMCKNFFYQALAGPRDLCERFQLAGGAGCLCARYEAGTAPKVLEGDVTGGVGQSFAESVYPCLTRSSKPGSALRQMEKILKSPPKGRPGLALPAASYDLVVSAMVVSQFCFEPLQYFSASLYERYPELRSAPEDRRLQRLRIHLFRSMLAGHLEEIRRLLAPGGCAYLSFELFHRKRAERNWFMPDYVAPILEEISSRFKFCDDVFPLTESLDIMPAREGESVVQAFLLKPV